MQVKSTPMANLDLIPYADIGNLGVCCAEMWPQTTYFHYVKPWQES